MTDTPLLFDVDDDSNEDTSGIFTPPETSSLRNGHNSLFTESFEDVSTPVSDVKLKSTHKTPQTHHPKEGISFDDGDFALVLDEDEGENDEENKSTRVDTHELRKCCANYIKVMDYVAVRVLIMVLWLTLAIVGFIWGLGGFLSSTTFAFHPIKGTPSDAAMSAFLQSFPDGDSVTVITVVAQLNSDQNDRTLLSPPAPLRNFTYALRDTINDYHHPDVVKGFFGYWTIVDGFASIGLAKRILGGAGAAVASGFMDAGNITTYLAVALQDVASDSSMEDIGNANKRITNFTKYLDDQLKNKHGLVPTGFDVWTTGFPLFSSDILKGVESNMGSVEMVAFPLAMVVLALMLRSVRLLLIPVFCIISSLLTTMLVLWPVAKVYPMVTFCPSVVISVVLALSIDYSLFLLSRFREENFFDGRDRKLSVENMLVFAGHTVLVSGCTICLCFLALVVFPAKMLASIGIGSGVAIVVTLLVNMTLTPAILLTFFGFFTHFQCLGLACCCCRNVSIKCWDKPPQTENIGRPDCPSMDSTPSAQSSHSSPLKNPVSHDQSELQDVASTKDIEGDDDSEWQSGFTKNRGCWLSVGICTQDLKYPLVVLMLLAVIPFAYYTTKMKFVHTFDLVAPRKSDSVTGYTTLVNNFGASKLFPSTLLIVPKDNTLATTEEFFARSQGYVKSISAYLDDQEHAQGFNETTFSGLIWNCALMDTLHNYGIEFKGDQGGCSVPFDLYDLAANGPTENSTEREAQEQLINIVAFFLGIPHGTALLQHAAYNLTKAYVNSTNQAMQLTVNIPDSVDLFGPEGGLWIDAMREAIDHTGRDAPDDIYLCKGDTLSHDAINIVFAYFPYVIAGTLTLVFLLVAISFRSIMVPLRSVLTITMTLAWVYGLAVLTYQYGILNWTNLPCVQEAGGLYWFAPVMSFSVVVGVGLDYDIFLLTRVLEYRRQALSESGAVVKGLVMSGHIITAAGVIMAIAFSGLLMSSETVMNQLAFLLVLSVLVDTFIVRSVLVPAIMGILGRANWWPQKLVPSKIEPYDNVYLRQTHSCCASKRKYIRKHESESD